MLSHQSLCLLFHNTRKPAHDVVRLYGGTPPKETLTVSPRLTSTKGCLHQMIMTSGEKTHTSKYSLLRSSIQTLAPAEAPPSDMMVDVGDVQAEMMCDDCMKSVDVN